MFASGLTLVSNAVRSIDIYGSGSYNTSLTSCNEGECDVIFERFNML